MDMMKKALEMSIRYNFVTDLTSMVVIVDEKVLPSKDKKLHKRVRRSCSPSDRVQCAPVSGVEISESMVITSAEADCQDENEEWKHCGIQCVPTCKNPNPTCGSCNVSHVCGCKNGFVRHEGRCILFDSCPEPECAANQELKKCYVSKFMEGSNIPVQCRDTCEENAEDGADCEMQCFPNYICICKRGFVYSGLDTCIPRNSCS
jgi:hypothetical protein